MTAPRLLRPGNPPVSSDLPRRARNPVSKQAHVTELSYRVTLEDTDVSGLLPRSWENELGRFILADGLLTVEPRQHFSDYESAHSAVQPWLRRFATGHHLTDGRRIHFELASSLTRHPEGRIDRTVTGHVTLRVSDSFSLVRHPQGVRYPQPLENFETNEDVDTAYQRWDNYLRGREPLPGVAYFVLSLLKRRAGSRPASDRFRISRKVLRRVGELSSRTGTPATARKADHREMTPEEEAWLKKAIECMILRLGNDEQFPDRITMDDLPPLDQRP